jgi:hypothetical protein
MDGRSGGGRSKSREGRDYSPLSHEPRKENIGSIANRIPNSAQVDSSKPSVATQERKFLSMTNDEI